MQMSERSRSPVAHNNIASDDLEVEQGLWWPSKEELLAALDAATRRFIDSEADLLRLDANERSLTHRFAVHLESQLPGWNVDCEYNRDGDLPKRLTMDIPQNVSAADTNARTVFPDIIV